ncbi:MAG: ABC transporter ATP-binding protein [Lachnospiraceae bacterium]|nr:ABC transporter ATP-binding protein [Lachnospiraceae bacterium]
MAETVQEKEAEKKKKGIIHTKDLCKSFTAGSVEQQVLKNLDLDIYKGDFTVIMGNSGSGKSTLLYALSGMDRPSLGAINYESPEGEMTNITGYDNNRLATFRRDHVGFVFQQNYLNDSMSALDNVMVVGLLRHSSRRELAEKAKELLKRVEIEEGDWDKFPAQMSGGMQQRVAVVRGVINSPEVLFADEPTGALNSQNTENVLNILSDLNAEGQSIVMVTHTLAAAERGNRIIYLSDGVISDEVELGAYAGDYRDEGNPDKEKATARHKKLKSFLQDMGW